MVVGVGGVRRVTVGGGDHGEGYACVGAGGVWEISGSFPEFYCES